MRVAAEVVHVVVHAATDRCSLYGQGWCTLLQAEVMRVAAEVVHVVVHAATDRCSLYGQGWCTLLQAEVMRVAAEVVHVVVHAATDTCTLYGQGWCTLLQAEVMRVAAEVVHAKGGTRYNRHIFARCTDRDGAGCCMQMVHTMEDAPYCRQRWCTLHGQRLCTLRAHAAVYRIGAR
ncbi:hypothetical protein NDU88_010119 [Pleurodeles waltl]|uniref:Uncharacterized protein n=1 Tax=Pleurodeles waltl TaxID=8319 RepID=A0AAV7PX14_PLEWA|nr:hypothetical protein NDU88_010119 [Pleurodeles waltl]